MLKLIAPMSKKLPGHPNNQDSAPEPENVSTTRTSTPMKTNATSSKTTPSSSRNRVSVLLPEVKTQLRFAPKN